MKKLLLSLLATSLLLSCSVENDDLYLQKGNIEELNATAENEADCSVNAGADNWIAYSNAYIDETVNDIGQIKGLYLNLLDEGVDRAGTFRPTMLEILRAYRKNNLGDFPTVYTIGEGECQDSVNLSITICSELPDAGADNSAIYPKSYIDQEITDIGQIKALYLALLEEGVSREGIFNPTITQIHHNYRKNPYQAFTTTYTLGEGKCSDTVDLTITIVRNQDEACNVNAGSDKSATYTNSYIVEEIDDIGEVKLLYLNLLDEGVLRNGTFDPSIEQIFRSYRKNNIGAFTTTYTLVDGNCQDSTVLTVNITE